MVPHVPHVHKAHTKLQTVLLLQAVQLQQDVPLQLQQQDVHPAIKDTIKMVWLALHVQVELIN